MRYFKNIGKTQIELDNNKPELELLQDLLKSTNLLIFAYVFITPVSNKISGSISRFRFQLLLRPLYSLTWLGDVAVLFLGLINKYLVELLISKTLSLAHSSSYCVPALTLSLFLYFYPSFY